ncbi:Type IVB pilus formation outer membrane protein, R64 PilN family [Pseudomonas sp. 8Z]|uniref:PilN family type IVB pilus formation outer membrane protein n=1 Tax=Pseudomonas sp. 8Z TaxID=2653166 RepID=UPI0012F03E41|nr:PilN family type IVB pilus formation outer membrane protein [Pseudomonas sp. 8Z]VXC24395.1 Type IVB pilus formation outer membrane protein, R64 PilN family [Pseudomonas sp. 8Z]
MMFNRRLKQVTALALLACALTGCAMQRVDESIRRTEAAAGSASAITSSMRTAPTNAKRDTVVHSDKPWVSTQPIISKRGLAPHQNCRFIWKPVVAVTLLQAAQEVMSQCGLNVQITPDAMNPTTTSAPIAASNAPATQSNQDMASMLFPSSVTGATSQGNSFAALSGFGVGATAPISGISWSDKVSGFLDLVTSRTGLSWRFDPVENAVVIYYLDTETFRIFAFDDTNQMDSTVRSGMSASTGVSGDSSSGTQSGGTSSGISGSSGSSQSTTVTLKTSLLNDIEGSVKSMLTPGVGRLALSRATGTLTVTDRPEVLRRVAQIIKHESDSITTQVILNVKAVSVTLTDKDQLSVDWNLVYKSLSDDWGINLKNTVPGIDPSAISGSVSILDTANNSWAGSNAMIQALAQQGRVSAVRSPSVTTLNLQSASIQIGQTKSYLASSQISNVAQVGSTTSLIPGTITSGYNMTLLPMVMPENELLLKININMSSTPTFEEVESGESKAQFPSYGVQIFDQKVRLQNGETLVLSGFEQDSEDANKTGTGDPGFFGLGGGRSRSSERTVIVVLITPLVMSKTASGIQYIPLDQFHAANDDSWGVSPAVRSTSRGAM